MATLKYSRQREAITHYLVKSIEHPTADMVYNHVKDEFPNISLGTVYRNLNLLTEMGNAIKINMPDGRDRFDGNITPHNHFVCKCCGTVLDIHINSGIRNTDLNSYGFDGIIESACTLFFGKCRSCHIDEQEIANKDSEDIVNHLLANL